jgi:heme exporter protein D
LATTLGQLRLNLKPHNLIDEITRDSGLRDFAAMGGFASALKRRPLAVLLLAGGVGLWAYSRARTSRAGVDRPGSVGATFASLANSAANSVRERARVRGQSARATAQNFIAAGTARFCDEVEKEVDDLIEGIPASADSRQLIKSAVDMAVLAAVEALLQTRLLKEPAE